MKIRIATRRSALALAQTRMIAADLRAKWPGLETEEVQIVTEGDRVQDRSLSAIGGKGLFIKELETALLDGRADLAVHSMKDLPADVAEGLVIAAVPPRESPWDLLLTRDGRAIDALPHGARLGTSSLRRRVQIHAARPDLTIEMLRGNIDTRLRKLQEGQFDAIVLAEAGVRRLQLDVEAVRLDAIVVPSIAQGALALETRGDDRATRDAVRALNDPSSETRSLAERAVLRAIQGSCTTPVGAIATLEGDEIALHGFLATADGARHVKTRFRGPADQPVRAGEALAAALLSALG